MNWAFFGSPDTGYWILEDSQYLWYQRELEISVPETSIKGVDGEHRVAKKENLNTVIAKAAHMGSGFQHQAGAGPPR